MNGRSEGRGARWTFAADGVLAAFLFVGSLIVVEGPDEDLAIRSLGEVPVGAFVVLGIASGALFWRRLRPLEVLAATTLATSVASFLDYSELIGLTMLIALYGVGRRVAIDRMSQIGLGFVLTLTVGTAVLEREATAAEVGFGLVVMSTIWYIGRRMRFRAERALQVERERAAEARRMVAEERTRIARELHDVVAHRVSVMTIQAGAAKTVAAHDPEGALRAMEAVEQAGRQALDELRHLLRVLRPETDPDGLGPQPGLADVPRLVDQFEAAGLDISLTIEDADVDVPAPVGLSAFRIVQEALTNVLKHAGPAARAEVRLRADRRGVRIEVLDDGRGTTTLPGSGHGIVGMRERASLLGGRLDAGPRPDGGFLVVAQLPVGQGPA